MALPLITAMNSEKGFEHCVFVVVVFLIKRDGLYIAIDIDH
jgi:hypothetical protein